MTLIEVLIVVVIVGIIASLAAPSFTGGVGTARVTGAAEALYAHLQLARSEAVKRNTPITVSFNAAAWCAGMIAGTAACDCTETVTSESDYCGLDMGGTMTAQLVTGNAFQGVTMAANPFTNGNTTIDNVRGTANNGSVCLTSSDGKVLRVSMSILGRVSICESGGTSYTTYPACSTNC